MTKKHGMAGSRRTIIVIIRKGEDVVHFPRLQATFSYL
jgi:hypothetical protein